MSRWLSLSVAGIALLFATQTTANECYSKFPAGVTPLGQVKICQSGFTGLQSDYSCQDYRAGNHHYRVIYKGGLEPKAIVKLNHGKGEQLIWSPSFGDPKMRCPLTAPASIPRHAKHRGLGVCIDNNDEDVACSVYEHAPVRHSRAYRYLVFYRQDGRGSELVHQMVAGNNQDAMVAEIAYQFGLSLLETRCCSEQASTYLEHAHRLFPKASAYREGYLQALEQVAVNTEDKQDL